MFGDFRPTREFFTHMETLQLPVKGYKFHPYSAFNGYCMSSEGSLACHTCCDTGHPFIMVVWLISEDPWHSNLAVVERLAVELSLPVLRGFDPLLLIFMNEIKIVSYSFSSSVIEYNSNEKLLKAWSGARFYKNQHMSYHDMKKTWHSRNKLHIFLLHTKIKSMQ